MLRCVGRFWHLADNPVALGFVRFWTKADKGGFWPAMVCPLMTQSGHAATSRGDPKANIGILVTYAF
jgi:hypothetical protein